MNRTIRLNKDLYDKLIEVQNHFKDLHHLELSMNYIINHLILEGMVSAPLLVGIFTNHLLDKNEINK